MSKVSVFKFSVNNSEENVKNLIHGYLSSRGLNYDNETMNYRTRIQSPKVGEVIGKALVSSILTGGRKVAVKNALDFGFEYFFDQGYLIIKSYLIDNKLNGKLCVHSFSSAPQSSNYFVDLQVRLFKPLDGIGVKLENKSVEKISDGYEGRNLVHTLKVCLLVFGPIVLFFILIILFAQ